MEEEGIPEEDEDGEEHHDSLNDSSNYSKPKLSDTDEGNNKDYLTTLEMGPWDVIGKKSINKTHNMGKIYSF